MASWCLEVFQRRPTNAMVYSARDAPAEPACFTPLPLLSPIATEQPAQLLGMQMTKESTAHQ